jgi:O-antigen/teichoic acid export membrane protein
VLYYIQIIKSYFSKGHPRSLLAKKNILSGFLIKGLSIIVTLILVPATIGLIDSYKYGIWLTLSSILGWISYFDVGLGNGLKNKLIEALAHDDIQLAKKYVSTTYGILILLVLSIAIAGILIIPLVDWARLLNVEQSYNKEITYLAVFTLLSVCLQFVLQLISVIFIAYQESFIPAFLTLLSNSLTLLFILFIRVLGSNSLFLVGIAYTIAPVIVLSIFSYYYFSYRLKALKPSLSFFNHNYAKDILSLGIKFFFIQIAYLIQYELISIILSRKFGPDVVTTYNITYKYFGILSMAFTIIIAPFWSHFSDALIKSEYRWIKNVISKLLKAWVGIALTGIIMFMLWNSIFSLWIGTKAKFDYTLSFWVLIYYLTYTFGNVFTMFLNGSGKILIQFFTYLITPIVFLILSKYLSSSLGPSGIVIAALMCNVYGILLAPYQYYLIINKKAKGIWNR